MQGGGGYRGERWNALKWKEKGLEEFQGVKKNTMTGCLICVLLNKRTKGNRRFGRGTQIVAVGKKDWTHLTDCRRRREDQNEGWDAPVRLGKKRDRLLTRNEEGVCWLRRRVSGRGLFEKKKADFASSKHDALAGRGENQNGTSLREEGDMTFFGEEKKKNFSQAKKEKGLGLSLLIAKKHGGKKGASLGGEKSRLSCPKTDFLFLKRGGNECN